MAHNAGIGCVFHPATMPAMPVMVILAPKQVHSVNGKAARFRIKKVLGVDRLLTGLGFVLACSAT